MNELTVKNKIGLVKKVLWNNHVYKSNSEYDDLFQEGSIGLWRAIKTYDEEKGVFSSYAYRNIQSNIWHYWRKQSAIKRTIPEDIRVLRLNKLAIIDGDIKPLEELLQAKTEYVDIDYKLILNKWLKTLSPRDSVVMYLILSEGYRHVDICKFINMSSSGIGHLSVRQKPIFKKYVKNTLIYNW